MSGVSTRMSRGRHEETAPVEFKLYGAETTSPRRRSSDIKDDVRRRRRRIHSKSTKVRRLPAGTVGSGPADQVELCDPAVGRVVHPGPGPTDAPRLTFPTANRQDGPVTRVTGTDLPPAGRTQRKHRIHLRPPFIISRVSLAFRRGRPPSHLAGRPAVRACWSLVSVVSLLSGVCLGHSMIHTMRLYRGTAPPQPNKHAHYRVCGERPELLRRRADTERSFQVSSGAVISPSPTDNLPRLRSDLRHFL